ncbi:MAG: hypothetical protein KIG14_01210 [Candidatus Sacchiramonaceae bacterium]|nr:hypothetical protein [Candidatus Saccharimonadaceae bacterium]
MAFISWWYSKGWLARAEVILDSLEKSIDYFSLSLLVKTWFAPFRQIDAGRLANASIEQRFRKLVDRTFSRIIGAMLRTVVMLVGIFYITLKALFGLLVLIIWIALPILPIVFVALMFSGWTPQIDLRMPEIELPQIIKSSNKTQTPRGQR